MPSCPRGPTPSGRYQALAVASKGRGFFIAGSLGVQDGGNVLLLVLYGYSEVTSLAFAPPRRLRELLWIAFGILCLMSLARAS